MTNNAQGTIKVLEAARYSKVKKFVYAASASCYGLAKIHTKENAKIIEQQAIGRASRIGQNKEVVVTRIIMENTIEHDYYKRNIS